MNNQENKTKISPLTKENFDQKMKNDSLSKIYHRFNKFTGDRKKSPYRYFEDYKNDSLDFQKVKESEIVIPLYSNDKNKKEIMDSEAKKPNTLTPTNQFFKTSSTPDSENMQSKIAHTKSLGKAYSLSHKKSPRKISSEPEEYLPRENLPEPIATENDSTNFIHEILKKKLEIKEQIKYLDDQINLLEESVIDNKEEILFDNVTDIKDNFNDLFISEIEQENKLIVQNQKKSGVRNKPESKISPVQKKKTTCRAKSNEPKEKSKYMEKNKKSPEISSKSIRIPIHERNKKWQNQKMEKLNKERVFSKINFR